MKRFLVPLLVLSVAAAAFFTRERWLPQPPGQDSYLGYVEGETVLVGAPQAGRLVSVSAVEGQAVRKEDVLFALDPAVAKSEVARAEAAAVAAQAAYQNLLSGKRSEELAVIRAKIRQVEASLELARKDETRAATLASTGVAARARLDAASEQVVQLEARRSELLAEEQVAILPAREAEIEAQAARLREAEAQLAMARDRLSDLSPRAPLDAAVEEVFFKPGEWVTAGQAVVSLLDPSDVRIRFFVPEESLARAVPGAAIRFGCDGCGGPKEATITRVASKPEFTPPVIYSEAARAKLVFLVEARPTAADPELRPGLPVSVAPLR